MKLVTVAEMQAIERESNERGWTYAQMMERAGQGLAEIVESFYGYEESTTITGLVGSGNNGGDTLIALTTLAESGWQARAYLVRPRPEGDPLLRRLLEKGGVIQRVESDRDFAALGAWLSDSVVLLDGIFGTGIRLPLTGEAAAVLDFVRQHPALPSVVAVDCPSGIDLDSGQAAEQCIPADVTVCMAAVKYGLLRFPAFRLAGSIEVVEIGLPADLATWQSVRREVVSDDAVRAILPVRSPDSHKGTYGTVTVVAGSLNYTGAALLASRAAHRIGAGLLQVAIPAPAHAALAGHFPEATWVLLPDEAGFIAASACDVLAKRIERTTVMLFGPGFGTEDATAAFVKRLLTANDLPPMVIDADGLKLLARVPDWPARLPAQAVLTPHPGEMSILTGLPTAEIQANRLEIASRYAAQWGHVVVLKGANTIIAAPDGRLALIPVATSALAHAGTGDVLGGMIAGLRAQGVPAYEAALAGAWLHAQSGLLAADHIGHEAAVLAGDLIDALPEVLAWVW